MSSRGRSPSPKPLRDSGDEAMAVDDEHNGRLSDAKVVIVTNLSRNVYESHLQSIFSHYGEVKRVDLPLYVKSGQNKGKAALEYYDAGSAKLAASHMNDGQIDGVVVKVELSDLPIRSPSRNRRPPPARNGRDRSPVRGRGRSYTPSRSLSPSRTPPRRRVPPPRGGRNYSPPPRRMGYGRDRSPSPVNRYGRRGGPPPRARPYSPRRSRSPPRRGVPPSRRRSPSLAYGGGRRRSPSYDRHRRRSTSRSPIRSRSHSRSSYSSRSYRSYSSRSRSFSRSRSPRGRRSYSADDIRDSRSRSRTP